jgi:ribosomal protein L11 methyltransferase
MSFIELELKLKSDTAEEVSDWFALNGALAVTLADAQDQPIFEPALNQTVLWDEVTLKVLFNDIDTARNFMHQVQQEYAQLDLSAHQFKTVPNQVWERVWLDYATPIKFGDKLWVLPHETAKPDDDLALYLDPGLAFGTGHHPTTAMCLEWLATHDLEHTSIIDYGCGSGILSVAALILGACHVWAIDHDPQAIQATLDNARKNHVDVQQLTVGLPEDVTLPSCDIFIANILASVLITHAPEFTDCVRPEGIIVLSGILQSQQDEIINAYPDFDFDDINIQDDWLCMSGTKK